MGLYKNNNGVLSPIAGRGDFEMVANKFSKGDLYSTDEKMIGQWTDGKPLYQKTITFNAVSCAVNTWTALLSTSAIPTNIASLIDAVVGYVDANHVDSVYAMNCQMYNGLRVWNPATTSFQANVITIRYTKTTDSAISIGSDTDYSTTEKIIGTWIDGKPLYQKTVSKVFSSAGNGTIPHGISNGVILNGFGVLIRSGSNTFHPLPSVSVESSTIGSLNQYSSAVQSIDGTNVNIYLGANRIGTVYYTLQYTKTTD